MPRGELRLLLVGGPMYDPLYARLRDFERASGWTVQIAAALPHPALNARIAREFGRGRAAFDVISTHTKYAPAQRAWLTPLDDDLGPQEIAAFHPHLLALARIDGRLYGLPRNLDVKLLYYRRDLFDDPGKRRQAGRAAWVEDRTQRMEDRALRVPQTWDDLRDAALHFTRGPQLFGFAFPGRESGLFGHFFELVAMAGGRLLAEHDEPAFDDAAGRWALGLLVDLYRRGAAPPQTPDWHYDEVAACFRAGQAAMTTDWPGGFYTYTDPAQSRVHEVFDLAIYPTGKAGRSVYAGSHTFAIPITVRDRPAAVDLLRFLTSEASQLLEARQGSLPTRPAVLAQVRSEAPRGSLAERRWALLEETVGAALFPPAHPRWPEIEEAIWQSAREALTGARTVDGALAEAARRVWSVVADRR